MKRDPEEWRSLDAFWMVRDAMSPARGAKPEITSTQGRVLMALLLFSNEFGECFPSVKRVAKIAGVSLKKTRSVILELESGVGPIKLSVDRNKVGEDGRVLTNTYRFTMPKKSMLKVV